MTTLTGAEADEFAKDVMAKVLAIEAVEKRGEYADNWKIGHYQNAERAVKLVKDLARLKPDLYSGLLEPAQNGSREAWKEAVGDIKKDVVKNHPEYLRDPAKTPEMLRVNVTRAFLKKMCKEMKPGDRIEKFPPGASARILALVFGGVENLKTPITITAELKERIDGAADAPGPSPVTPTIKEYLSNIGARFSLTNIPEKFRMPQPLDGLGYAEKPTWPQKGADVTRAQSMPERHGFHGS